MTFHGTDDPYLAYEGGYGPKVASLPSPDGKGTIGDGAIAGGSDALPIPERVDAWAKRNGCTAAGNDQWTCPGGADVVLYTIEGGGHTWPGSKFDANLADLMGPTSTDLDATALMWQFFATHPLAG
jgi:polyhydroxybutyrate depolymerase